MNKSELTDRFNTFGDYTILVVGDVMIDAYLRGNVERISPEAPVPVVLSQSKENRLGGAANVALNVRSLGANPILCSVIGTDEDEQTFRDLLHEQGLTDSGIISGTNRPTTKKTRIISDNQQMLRIDSENTAEISPELQQTFIDSIKQHIVNKKIDAIIFEDYDKGVITPDIIKTLVDVANQSGIVTLVDPKKRNFLQYKNVTMFKPNFKELKDGIHIEVRKDNTESIKRASDTLRNDLNAEYIFVTLSEHGSFITNNDEYHAIPAEIRNIADVSGAGDTVISIAALTLLAGFSPRRIAEIANLGGGIVCEHSGATPIQKDKLLEEAIMYYESD